jgi:hypothetical protein
MLRSVHARRCLFALLGISLTSGSVFAQTSFDRISGTATDPGGSAILQVKITIRNTATQNVRTIETDAAQPVMVQTDWGTDPDAKKRMPS